MKCWSRDSSAPKPMLCWAVITIISKGWTVASLKDWRYFTFSMLEGLHTVRFPVCVCWNVKSVSRSLYWRPTWWTGWRCWQKTLKAWLYDPYFPVFTLIFLLRFNINPQSRHNILIPVDAETPPRRSHIPRQPPTSSERTSLNHHKHAQRSRVSRLSATFGVLSWWWGGANGWVRVILAAEIFE